MKQVNDPCLTLNCFLHCQNTQIWKDNCPITSGWQSQIKLQDLHGLSFSLQLNSLQTPTNQEGRQPGRLHRARASTSLSLQRERAKECPILSRQVGCESPRSLDGHWSRYNFPQSCDSPSTVISLAALGRSTKSKAEKQPPAEAISPGKLLGRHRLVHPKDNNGALGFLHHPSPSAIWILGGKASPLSISLSSRCWMLLAELVQRRCAAVQVWRLEGSKAPQGVWEPGLPKAPLEDGRRE